MNKVKVGIIGTGNIGCDLLAKVMKSPIFECGIFAGHNDNSKGIKRAQQLGVPTTTDSIDYIVNHPECCDIVFDATSASVHRENAPILRKLGKFAIDLTPANVGKFCIPAINWKQTVNDYNVNMVTCGGQATIPIAYAISKVQTNISYFEIVSTISSSSAGPGTRANIDEFTQTTKKALIEFTGVKSAKAIIILNPAEPPITMHNTLYAIVDNPNMELIKQSVKEMEQTIRKYVPGYTVITEPIYENGRLTTTIGVVGAADYLPSYAGNLDIITSASIEIARLYVLNCIHLTK